MTFNQIALKMARAQSRKYMSYFLCNAFAVFFFFLFASVYFNETVAASKKLDGVQGALIVPSVALAVFTLFFIGYAHHLFMKKRRSEFGLFLSIGMSAKEIGKLLLIENAIIALLALLSGLFAGAVFSRLFFLLLTHSVGLDSIPFHLSWEMFGQTILLYLLVFMAAVGHSLFFTLKQTSIQQLKSNRTAEKFTRASPLLGGLGVAIVAGSLLGLYATYTDPVAAEEFLLLWTFTTFLGLYISLTQLGGTLINISRKNKRFYYRRLLVLTSLDHKMKQLSAILMVISVLVMVTILYGTIILSSYLMEARELQERNPYDIAMMQMVGEQLLPDSEIESIILAEGGTVKEWRNMPLYTIEEKSRYSDWPTEYVFLPLDAFNLITNGTASLDEHEYILFNNSTLEYEVDDSLYGEEIVLASGMTFHQKQVWKGQQLNWILGSQFIVIENEAFDRLMEEGAGSESSIYLIDVTDWKASGSTVEALERELSQSWQDYVREDGSFLPELGYRIGSKAGDDQLNKNSNGTLLFVMTFLSILFFTGSFVLMFLHLSGGIDEEIERFRKLNRIGMAPRERKRLVSKEIAALFFIPASIGMILAFLYLVAMAKDIGGIMENPELVWQFLSIAGCYLLIQTVCYVFSRSRMIQELRVKGKIDM